MTDQNLPDRERDWEITPEEAERINAEREEMQRAQTQAITDAALRLEMNMSVAGHFLRQPGGDNKAYVAIMNAQDAWEELKEWLL